MSLQDSFSLRKLLKLDALVEHLKGYVETQTDLLKIEVEEKVSELLVTTISSILLAVSLLLFFFFMSIGLAILLGNYLGGMHYGFFVLGAFYLSLFLLLLRFKHTEQLKEYLYRNVFNKKDQTNEPIG